MNDWRHCTTQTFAKPTLQPASLGFKATIPHPQPILIHDSGIQHLHMAPGTWIMKPKIGSIPMPGSKCLLIWLEVSGSHAPPTTHRNRHKHPKVHRTLPAPQDILQLPDHSVRPHPPPWMPPSPTLPRRQGSLPWWDRSREPPFGNRTAMPHAPSPRPPPLPSPLPSPQSSQQQSPTSRPIFLLQPSNHTEFRPQPQPARSLLQWISLGASSAHLAPPPAQRPPRVACWGWPQACLAAPPPRLPWAAC